MDAIVGEGYGGVGGLEEVFSKKKRPAAQLNAFDSDRYEALRWAWSIILIGKKQIVETGWVTA